MNDNKELYKTLESLNKEKQDLINSPEYVFGVARKKYLNMLRKLDFVNIFKSLKELHVGRVVQKKYVKKIKNKNDVLKIFNETCEKKKIAIYTCVTGGYDDIQVPLVRFDNVDYVLFVDDKSKYDKYKTPFIIKELSKEILNNGNILANRYVKFHPFELLKEYDYAIYIDGNTRIVSDVRWMINNCNEKTGIAMYRHSERDCIYDEAEVCKLLKRGNKEYIDKQISKYRKDNFPENFGMNEANVIVIDLHNKESKELLDAWWEELINSKSMRDQLAWPYVLWKKGYAIEDVGLLGYDSYQNYGFEFKIHK